jgi:hypothetical protein
MLSEWQTNYWEKSVIFNDGVGNGSGNDEVMRVLGYENLAFIFCVDRLVCFDLNTGAFKYNVPAGWVDARMIDGVMYNIDDSDLVMRDPYTGKELKRAVATPGEQVFASMRPNGADGRIFIHSYSHAYCLKAYSK